MSGLLDLWAGAASKGDGDPWDGGRLPGSSDRPKFEPRPYQVEARAAVRAMWSEHGPTGPHPLIIAATGTGKTKTALFIVMDTLAEGGRVAWLAHREELLHQPLADLGRDWPRVRGGIVQAARDQVDAQLVFCSVDTLRVKGRAEAIVAHGYPDVVVVDEAHRSLSPTHRKAIEKLCGPNTVLVGLTATADREDGGDLSVLWEVAYTYGPTEAIAGGWLVPPWVAIDKLAHLDEAMAEVPINAATGDYNAEAAGKVLLQNNIVDHTVKAIQAAHVARRQPFGDEEAELSAKNRPAMVFCATLEQAEKTCEALRGAGIEARFIHQGTPSRDRKRLLGLFREGRLQVLVNVMTLTEGTDVPIASCIVLARPTKSWSLYVQAVGRGMRLHDPAWKAEWGACNALDPRYAGKRDCFVLDLAGASSLHSIVSAPVLIGGSRCPDADDGVHDYKRIPKGPKGQCSHCERVIRCFASLAAADGKRDGRHDWVDYDNSNRPSSVPAQLERACRFCATPQCPRSKDGRHAWSDLEVEQITLCLHCDAEMPYRGDVLQGLVGKKPVNLHDKEIDELLFWVTRKGRDRKGNPIPLSPGVPAVGLVPEVIGCEVEGEGLVLVVGDSATGLWQPYWIRERAKKPRPLSSGPVSRDDVRLRCVDLLRRAQRNASKKQRDLGWGDKPATPQQVQLGWTLGLNLRGVSQECASREITRGLAWKRAVALGLAKPATNGRAP